MMTNLRTSLALSVFGLVGGHLGGLLGGVAHADSPGVVVLGFEGDGSLASSTRGAVIELVSRDYGVIAPRRWADALNNDEQGSAAWALAAHDLGVVAVVEGKLVKSGKGKVLRVVVRNAHTGKTVEEISTHLEREGLSGKAKADLEVELVDALFLTADPDHSVKPEQQEPPTKGKRRAGSASAASAAKDGEEELTLDDSSDAMAPAKGEVAPPRISAETKVNLGASQSGVERMSLFEAPKSDGSGRPEAAPATSPARAPIADITLTGAAISRQFGFTGAVLPSDYPGSTVTSLGVAGAIYPIGDHDERHRLTGFGLSGSLTSAVSSDVPVTIDDMVYDFPVTQRSWELAGHYRYAAGPALVDGHLGFASLSHAIEDIPEDADETLDLLDAEYSYVDMGGRVEVEAGPRTTLGFSASYLYVTQLGALTDADMLGNASSWGMEMGLDLKVELGHRIFAAAGADYRRIHLTFDGDGAMYDDLGIDVDEAQDTFVGGHLQVGVGF
jgi:hypothetical protein